MRPLVCLHGFTGGPSSWERVLARLPEETQVHRPPVLGHGAGSEARSFVDEVDRLAASIEERAVAAAVLAGYSMGARLALGLLVRHPRLFAAGVLVAPHPGLRDAGERRERARSDEALARRLEVEGLESFVDAWQELPLFATQKRLPPAVLAEQRAQRLAHHPAGLARALRVLSTGQMPGYRDALSRLDLPLRLLAGGEDRKFCRLAREITTAVPHAELTIVPGVGHNLCLEAPGAVARVLRQELADSEPAASSAAAVEAAR